MTGAKRGFFRPSRRIYMFVALAVLLAFVIARVMSGTPGKNEPRVPSGGTGKGSGTMSQPAGQQFFVITVNSEGIHANGKLLDARSCAIIAKESDAPVEVRFEQGARTSTENALMNALRAHGIEIARITKDGKKQRRDEWEK
ncbi:MAG: hypothetical protein U5N86_02925 [Planctomycetota bacterium]|nr:hypothetical protein [Planctomycetota bacterium]